MVFRGKEICGLFAVVASVLALLATAGCAWISAAPPEKPGTGTVTVDARRPFAGSPAEKYADGRAGIAAPKARAVRGFTAKEVAETYAWARKVMVAAHLDRPTLAGEKPNAYLRLLDSDERKDFVKNLNSPSMDHNTRILVTSFAPGTAELVGDVIKVSGSMTAKSVASWIVEGGRQLNVVADYRFVYAVRKPGEPEKITRVVVRDRSTIAFYRIGPDKEEFKSVEESEIWVAGADCDRKGGFIYPDYELVVAASGDAVDPYSSDEPSTLVCGQATRI
jgi:hypothetical protein